MFAVADLHGAISDTPPRPSAIFFIFMQPSIISGQIKRWFPPFGLAPRPHVKSRICRWSVPKNRIGVDALGNQCEQANKDPFTLKYCDGESAITTLCVFSKIQCSFQTKQCQTSKIRFAFAFAISKCERFLNPLT